MGSKELARRFGKAKLLDVAEELGLSIKASTHIYEVADIIVAHMDEHGLPEDEVSEDLWDLMVAAEFIDDDGNELERDTATEDVEESDEEGGEQARPDCWGKADEDDPGCKKCRILKACVKLRDDNRPNCFGKAYDSDAPECGICIHWMACERLTKRGK